MKWLGLLGVLGALALAGCGGGGDSTAAAGPGSGQTPKESEEAAQASRIRPVVGLFSEAIGSGDVETLCLSLDPQVYGQKECEATFGGSSTPFERSFLTAKIERIVVNGETAVVALSNHQAVQMKEIGERWVVEDFGGPSNMIG